MSEQQVIRIYESSDRCIIQNLQNSTLISINRETKFIKSEDISLLNNINIYKVYKSSGILGIINLNLYSFIISICEAKKIGKIGNTEISQVLDVEFVQIDHKIEGKPFYNFDYINFEINQLTGALRQILSEGLYFSKEFDLTNSLQAQKNIKIANNGSYDIIKHANAKYLCNNQILNSFYENNIFSTDFIVNAIFGYVNVLKENINNTDFSYILISRKNVNNLDLKNFSLGFDKYGFASNTVETEQIILFGLNAFSYVQIKSAPPIKNSILHSIHESKEDEKKIRAINFNENLDAFASHIDQLNKEYRFIYLINLLNKNNLQENLVNSVIEHNIKNAPNTNFKYNYYNFDEMCLINNSINNQKHLINTGNNTNTTKNRDNIEIFLSGIENVLNIFKHFGVTFDSQNNKTLVDQIGIIRIFCKDGMERSNIIEMRIGWMILENQLRSLKINPMDFFGADIISVKEFERTGMQNEEFLKNPKRKGIEFIIKFKKIWKENSQMLNLLFTGFNKGNAGQGQLLGGKDTNRIPIDLDEYLTQSCLDVLLDKTPVKINTIQDSDLINALEDNYKEYCSTKNILTYVGTYNLGGKDFKEPLELLDWLLPDELKTLERIPEIYIIGLQEIVELNASNILISSNSPKVDYWRSTLQSNLDAIGKYQLIKCLDLVGVVMLVFVKKEIIEKIKNFDFLIQKTGMMGTMGNKGSCLMRFELHDTSIAFSSGHFAAGQSSNSSRIAELLDILGKNFTIQRQKKFQEHDIFFLFGDLNFRLDLDNNSVRRMIENKSLDTLVVYDQFIKTRNVNFSLNCLEEGNLTFNPTYKYSLGTNEYDSKAKRIPSWCDRIFYKKSKLIKLICYNRSEYLYSDHKPVYGLFELKVLKEEKEEKNKFSQYLRRVLTFGFKIKQKLKIFDAKEEEGNGSRSNNSQKPRIQQQNVNVSNNTRNGVTNNNINFNPNNNVSNKNANANNLYNNQKQTGPNIGFANQNNLSENINITNNPVIANVKVLNEPENRNYSTPNSKGISPSNINVDLIDLEKINLNNNNNNPNNNKNINLIDISIDKNLDSYFGNENVNRGQIKNNNINSHSFNTKNTHDLINLNEEDYNKPKRNEDHNMGSSQKMNEEDILSFFK